MSCGCEDRERVARFDGAPRVLLMALLVSIVCGCQTAKPRFVSGETPAAFVERMRYETGSLGGILGQRLADLGDIVDFKLSYGPGWFVNLRVTKFLQIGGGEGKVTKRGWTKDGPRRYAGTWVEDASEVGIGFAYIRHFNSIEPVSGEAPKKRKPDHPLAGLLQAVPSFDIDSDFSREMFGVGLTLHAGVGVETELKPSEVLDFFVGWVGLDLKKDDLASRYKALLADKIARADARRARWCAEAASGFSPSERMEILLGRWRRHWAQDKKEAILQYIENHPHPAALPALRRLAVREGKPVSQRICDLIDRLQSGP